MKKALVLILVVLVIAALSGCAGKTTATSTTLGNPGTDSAATTTTEVTPTTSAATTTTAAEETTTTLVPVSFDNASVFTADLSGTEVVPAVDTLGKGTAVFKIDPTSTRGYFKLTLSNVSDVLASRLHEGATGSNGQGLLILYPGPTLTGPYSGVIAQGYFDASALIGSLKGKTLADLAVLLQGGKAYVNVGTVKNPQGEIRGQIREDTNPADAN